MSKVVIATEKAPGAIGPYSQAIQVGNIVSTSSPTSNRYEDWRVSI